MKYDANGLGTDIDWLGLTYNQRLIRGINKPYHEVAEKWQYFYDWVMYNFPRVYIQLARGHDKTERGAWWSLLWGKSRPDGQALCCGTDKENAKLYLDAVKWQKKYHPKLFHDVTVNKYDVNFKNGSHIRVIPVNEGGSFGHTPDLLMVNDFHAWKNQTFWDNLWTAMGKRPNARIWIESNALALGTPQAIWIKPFRDMVAGAAQMDSLRVKGLHFYGGEVIRDRIVEGPEWFFAKPHGMHASWQWHMLRQWKESMLPTAFRRLIQNEDVADGDQFLTQEQYEACEYDADELPAIHPDAVTYVCVDMAVTQDAAVVSLVSGYRRKDDDAIQITLLPQKVWSGSRSDPIMIDEVVNYANKLADEYNARRVCDPWEMRAHVQRDPRWGTFEFHKGEYQRKIPLYIYKAFTGGLIKVPKDCGPAIQAKEGRKPSRWDLKTECINAVLVEKAYGTRLDHKSGGFTDRIMSLGMGVVKLMDGQLPRLINDPKRRPKTWSRWSWEQTWGDIVGDFAPKSNGCLVYCKAEMDAKIVGTGPFPGWKIENFGLDPRHVKGGNKGGVDGAILCVSEIPFGAGVTATDLHSAAPYFKMPIRVHSFKIIKVGAGGASDTGQLAKYDGTSATAISDALDLNVADHVVVRAGTLDDVERDLAAGETLRIVSASDAVGVAVITWSPRDVPVTP